MRHRGRRAHVAVGLGRRQGVGQPDADSAESKKSSLHLCCHIIIAAVRIVFRFPTLMECDYYLQFLRQWGCCDAGQSTQHVDNKKRREAAEVAVPVNCTPACSSSRIKVRVFL